MGIGFTISLCIVLSTFTLLIVRGCIWFFKEYYQTVSKHTILTIVAAIFLIISIPFLINESYIQNKGCITVWEGKDLLAFYGSILSFIGTVSLGILALWQNHQFKNLGEKQEKRNIAVMNYPIFEFGDIEYFYWDEIEKENRSIPIDNTRIPVRNFNGNKMIWQTFSSQTRDFLNIKIHFENIGNTLATGVYVEGEVDKARSNHNVLDENEDPIKYVLPRKKGIVLINIPLSKLRKSKKEIYIVNFSNPFGSQYKQLIEIMLKHDDKTIEIQTLINVEIKEVWLNERNNS